MAFCSEESEYQDRIQLKSQADRTLGVGVHQGNNSLLVLTASSMMQVQLSLDKIRRFSPQTGRTNLIKSTMMQAILYGSLPEVSHNIVYRVPWPTPVVVRRTRCTLASPLTLTRKA